MSPETFQIYNHPLLPSKDEFPEDGELPFRMESELSHKSPNVLSNDVHNSRGGNSKIIREDDDIPLMN